METRACSFHPPLSLSRVTLSLPPLSSLASTAIRIQPLASSSHQCPAESGGSPWHPSDEASEFFCRTTPPPPPKPSYPHGFFHRFWMCSGFKFHQCAHLQRGDPAGGICMWYAEAWIRSRSDLSFSSIPRTSKPVLPYSIIEVLILDFFFVWRLDLEVVVE